ncbi:hypothetical protein [Mycoplasmopsis felifaucium]|uniref:hypothetical protein n=1 Tax=Mycoplasmopsis felifaucium TaxID=35768 RepID=UPI0004841949|nr:hypothetical protein [Mycoplasmopsis felifaucium]
MEETKLNNKEFENELPLLKPLPLKMSFISKINGDNKLSTNIVMLIAQEDNYVFFVNCLSNHEVDKANKLELSIVNGHNDKNELCEINLCRSIILDVIYKMNKDELVHNFELNLDEIQHLPYISMQDQFILVEKISEIINGKTTNAKLVLIKKKQPINNIMNVYE